MYLTEGSVCPLLGSNERGSLPKSGLSDGRAMVAGVCSPFARGNTCNPAKESRVARKSKAGNAIRRYA